MAVDPDLQARVVAVSGASLDQADDPAFGAATAKAFVAVGIESPAAQLAPVAIFSIDELGALQSWNRACESLFGWTQREVIGGAPPLTFVAPSDDPLVALAASTNGSAIQGIPASVRHRDGHTVHVLLAATRIRSEDAGPSGIVAFASDVTGVRESEIATEAANHRWRHLLMNISDTITITDRFGRVKETTGEITDILGYAPEVWSGSNGFELIHPDEQGRAAELWDLLLRTPGIESSEIFRTRHSDGHYELIEYTATNMLDDPVIAGMVLTTRNVTRERRAEGLLADEAKVLELIARDAPLDETLAATSSLVEFHGEGGTAIMLIGRETGAVTIGSAGSVAPEFLLLWHQIPWPPESHGFDLSAPTIIEDLAADPRTRPYAAEAATFGVIGGYSVPILANRSNAVLGVLSTYYEEARRPTAHERNVSAVATNLAAIAIERSKWHRELSYQARHHPVTGLPNRASIREHLDAALVRRAESDGSVAVMFVDLDRFKVVNDSLGHAAGDLLLVRFAGRLSNLVRPGDFVGHFGADGFIVILEDITDREDVRFIAHRLEVALGEPFALEENEVYVSASIGVAICDDATGANETSDELIQHADAAMFRAKDLGRGRMEIFDHAMRRRAGERLRIDRDLRVAIERGEFEVHYQPEIDLHSGSVIGVEALLRWNHPELGLLLPEDFLDVAEDTGLIVSIGTWVFEQALAQARAWASERSGAPLTLAVNLSSRQLSAPGLVQQIAALLEHHHWAAEHLVVELDESALMRERDATLEVLTQLRSLGVRIAIDDFGTGFSSLSYLHRFPVDVVKIDQSFVVSVEADGTGSPVVTAIVHMAHALDIVAAAEGVEEARQLDGLRALGCDRAQGFLFSGALAADDLTDLLHPSAAW